MEKRLQLTSLCLLILSITCLSQPPGVSFIGNNHTGIEYKCITAESSYTIEMPVFRVDDLYSDTSRVYNLYMSTSQVFDILTYYHFPDGFKKYGSYWKWKFPDRLVDTVVLSFDGLYQNLDLGDGEAVRFGIFTTYPTYGDQEYFGIEIVPPNPDMEINGPDLVCDNPVYFYLQNMPTTYTTASWEIKRGSFIANSGNGTTATANNLSNGAWEVVFTIHFSCGLKNLEYKKEFWFGPPPAPTISPATIVYKSINNVFGVSIVDSPQADPSTGIWETYGCVTPNGTPSGSSAEFFSCDVDGCGTIYVSTSNTCGTYYKSSLTVITGNGGDCGPLPERASSSSISLSPNPANSYVELRINKVGTKLDNKGFRVEIYNTYFSLVKLININQSNVRLDISDLPHGNYIIKVIGLDFNASKQLIIQK